MLKERGAGGGGVEGHNTLFKKAANQSLGCLMMLKGADCFIQDSHKQYLMSSRVNSYPTSSLRTPSTFPSLEIPKNIF